MPPADARVRDRGAPGGAESHRAVPCSRQGDGTGVPGRAGPHEGLGGAGAEPSPDFDACIKRPKSLSFWQYERKR